MAARRRQCLNMVSNAGGCRARANVERSRRDYLRRVGLSHVEQAWPRELSGGMLKRVANRGCVLRNGGEVLLLDEPFGALDYVTRRQLQDVLLDLWEEPGRVVSGRCSSSRTMRH